MRMSRENIEKKRANTSVLIRKADAFGAVIEAAAREESENDVLRRIDRIPTVVGANVAYLCDGRKCDSCSGECRHTLDVSHAKNFSQRDGAYFENEEPQKDQPVKGLGVFIPGVTVEMIRMAPLEGIEELLNNGEMYNVPNPTEANRSLPAGDYISRADAIEAICNKCGGCDDNHDECWEITALKALPSAEAEEYEDYEHATLVDIKEPLRASAEAVQGEWIDKGNWMGIECSRCKCHSQYVTPFCPQCGARMIGGDSE